MNFRQFIPNFISFFRIVCSPLFLFALSSNWVLLSILIVTLAGVSDFLDGYLARRLNATSKLGKLLDPLADKAFCCCALWGLCFCNENTSSFILTLIAVFLTIRDMFFIFGFVFIRIKKLKIETEPIWIGKICTFLVFVFSVLSMILDKNNAFLTFLGFVCLFFILISTFMYFRRFFLAKQNLQGAGMV